MPDTLLLAVAFLAFLAVRAMLSGPPSQGRHDIVAVRSEFDRMLVRKGLVTADQLDMIRSGTRSRGVVTGMRATGEAREDYREVELDLMVRRPEGGQFPAHERTLVPASALTEVAPGSLVDAYYRRGDETAVAVCVPPR